MKEEIKYEEAIMELETIVSELEKGEISIDIMSEKIKHSLELIEVCKTKLKTTQEDVKKIIEEIYL